jgi:hypothetical protein
MIELLPKEKGNLTELQCITSFYELGYQVSIPYGENSRYDFIADVDGILLKIQVKTSHSTDNGASIEFSCRSTRVNSKNNISRKYTSDEIDYFCTYYNNQCYLIPVAECSATKKLRFEAPKNGQKTGVNYAKNYKLRSQIEKIKG